MFGHLANLHIAKSRFSWRGDNFEFMNLTNVCITGCNFRPSFFRLERGNCGRSARKTIRLKSIRPRMEVDLPDEQTVHQITKIKLLFNFLISFSYVCKYLLTALSKQLLIQPLEYLTSLELLRSKAKSFCYVIDTSRPNI